MTSAEPDPPSKKRTLLMAVLVAAVILLVFLGKRLMSPTPTAAPSASANTTATTASAAHAPKRAVRYGAGARGPLQLGGGKVVATTKGAPGTIEGIVISRGDNKGIAGATVSFSAGSLHAVQTDTQGRFRFATPRPGTYELALATAKGFLPFAPEWGHSPVLFAVSEATSIRGVRLELTPALTYHGIVLSPDGKQPIAKAKIRLRGGAEDQSWVSDAQGRFDFHAHDQSILEATHPSYAAGRGRVGFSTQVSKQLRIRLRDKGSAALSAESIRGVVLEPDGKATDDALVVARFEADNPASDAQRFRPEVRATTDEQGQFELSGLDAGKYTVIATRSDFAPAVMRSVLASSDNVRLKLGRGRRLYGQVRDAKTGAAVASFAVVVARMLGALQREVVVVEPTFDAEGRYDIPNLPRGDYRVMVTADDYAPSQEHKVSLQDDEAKQDFSLRRGGTVRGRVLDEKDKRALQGARVSLEGYMGSGQAPGAVPLGNINSALTDSKGAFTLRGIGPGKQSLLAAASGHHGRIRGGIELSDGQTVQIEILLAPTKEGEKPRIELGGIGARLSVKGDVLLVGGTIEGGGAAEVGLVEGDAIVAIEGVSVAKLGFGPSIQRIRGPEGTVVRLLILKKGTEQPIELLVPRRIIRA